MDVVTTANKTTFIGKPIDSLLIAYIRQAPFPYIGKNGPDKNPGFTHFLVSLIILLKNNSKIQPTTDPIKNTNKYSSK
jgi:hypothetical protein